MLTRFDRREHSTATSFEFSILATLKVKLQLPPFSVRPL